MECRHRIITRCPRQPGPRFDEHAQTLDPLILLLAVSGVCAPHPPVTKLDMTTWSISALDPQTGDVGPEMA